MKYFYTKCENSILFSDDKSTISRFGLLNEVEDYTELPRFDWDLDTLKMIADEFSTNGYHGFYAIESGAIQPGDDWLRHHHSIPKIAFVVYLAGENIEWEFRPVNELDGLETAWNEANMFHDLYIKGVWNISDITPVNDSDDLVSDLVRVNYSIKGIRHTLGLAVIIDDKWYYDEGTAATAFDIWKKRFIHA